MAEKVATDGKATTGAIFLSRCRRLFGFRRYRCSTNIAAGEAAVRGEVIAAAVGWGVGLPLAFLGWAIPHWRSRLDPATLTLIHWQAIRWAPFAVLLAVAYVVGPDIYHRAIERILSVSTPPLIALLKKGIAETQKSTLMGWLSKPNASAMRQSKRSIDYSNNCWMHDCVRLDCSPP